MHIIISIILTISICSTAEQLKYPELDKYIIFESGPWSKLIPGKSTVEDVRSILGNGNPSKDVGSLLCFDGPKDFKLFVYFTGKIDNKESLLDSLDFIPKNREIMVDIKWTDNFKPSKVKAADAGWIEYTDSSGLVYEVYTSKTQFGGHMPGDLNRISYRKASLIK